MLSLYQYLVIQIQALRSSIPPEPQHAAPRPVSRLITEYGNSIGIVDFRAPKLQYFLMLSFRSVGISISHCAAGEGLLGWRVKMFKFGRGLLHQLKSLMHISSYYAVCVAHVQ